MTYPPGTRTVYVDFRLALPARMRATQVGLATLGCQANPLGARPRLDERFESADDAFATVDTIREYLDGSERWAIDRDASGDEMDEWELVKTAGPYEVEETDAGLRLTCACGWKGKTRPLRMRKTLNADQAAHAC